jgi:CRISPR/Cas system-associated exonuclease Cas4 (RecB family)
METSDDDIPSLRSIEDIRGGVDLEKVFNLSELYALGIDNSTDEHMQRAGVWHPSAVGMCKRSQVLQFTRVEPTDRVSKKLQEIFAHGHMHHDRVQSVLKTLGKHLPENLQYDFQSEVGYDKATDKLYLEADIGGTCDGILRIWDETFEQRGVVEIKSQNDERHQELVAMKTAWPNHLMQAHIYAFRFNTPIIWVFYINKNNAKREVKQHLFEDAIFDSAIMYFDQCADFVRAGELPPREESWFSCSECVYRTLCKPTVLARKQQHPELSTLTIRRR